MILFSASPDSISSLRLMVMVLRSGGGSLGAEGLAIASGDAFGAAPGKTVFGREELFEAAPAVDADSTGAEPVSVESFAVVEVGSSGPIAGGSDESAESSSDGRPTITVSPASLAIPPASASTSRIVTDRSAWYTMVFKDAATTEMGLLFLSFTLTLT